MKMNICKDCKYSYRTSILDKILFNYDYMKCSHEKSTKKCTNPVSGIKNETNLYCVVMRDFDHLCGKEGKFFEPKGKNV
jgi:hypothetical protein